MDLAGPDSDRSSQHGPSHSRHSGQAPWPCPCTHHSSGPKQGGLWLQGKASGWGCLGQGLKCPLPPARAELSEHLDAMDSNLDNLQTMLTSHGFSVDTTALLDVSRTPSPPCPVPLIGRA